MSARFLEEQDTVEVGLTMHDTNYSIDFCIHRVPVSKDPKEREVTLTQHCLKLVRRFSDQHRAKFIGAGIGKPLFDLAPHLCSALWKELDIVSMVLSVYIQEHGFNTPVLPAADEQADSVVRKLIMHFGPGHLIRVQIGFRNLVEVDEGGLIRIVESLDDYKTTVREPTWRALLKITNEIKTMGTKIAFFSSTPQGGGVALMRHALIRLFKLLGVDAKWYLLNDSL
jgi:alpha,alpha-trehalose phosphorylase (configuration-retaining)